MRNARTLLLTLSTIILVIMAGCNNGASEARLAQIDSLIERRLDDSARAELSRIAQCDLKSKEDVAHYNLLKTNLSFRNGEVLPNDSMIDISIKHYRLSGDKGKLALSLYIKGRIQYKRNEIKNAFRNLLEAADIAKETDDDALKAKIYTSLAFFNKRLGENRYALKYIKQALIYTTRIRHDKAFLIPGTYIQASDIYGNLKDTANAIAYMEKCIPYIEYTDSFGKANIYSGLANIYNVKGDYEKAKVYGTMAINIRPKHDTYYILSQTYMHEGDVATADSMRKMAIKMATPNYKMMMLAEIMNEKQGVGLYKDASVLGDSIISLHDSITRRNQTDSIIEIQATFNISQKGGQRISKLANAVIIVTCAAISLLVITTILLYLDKTMFKKKADRARQELQSLMDKNDKAKAKLDKAIKAATEANMSNATGSQDAELMKAHQQEAIAQASNPTDQYGPETRQCLAELYEMIIDVIINNNCIAHWSNDKIARFIGYCCCAIPGLNDRMENGYTNLTKQNRLMIIFTYLNKSKEDICKIMDMNDNTYRQAVNRLKKKITMAATEPD